MTKRKFTIDLNGSISERPVKKHPNEAQPQTNSSTKNLPAISEEDIPSFQAEELTEDSDTPTPILIHTNLLIPGKGTPAIDSNVVLQGNKIVFVGPSRSLPRKYARLIPTYVPVLLPGLWDCHCHFMGAESFNFESIVTINPATAGARLARSCADILDSGFTSVRELGGWACEVSPAVEEGTIPGPNIYSAGAALSQTAGHGDVFNLPVGWAWQRLGVGRHANGENVGVSPLCLADGVDEVRKAVRLQIRRGAKVIKVLASGGVLSIGDDPMLQQFSDEELKTIVDEAGRMGRVVAAHVHGKAGIMAAIRAGCKTLEHGTYLDEECIEEMKKKDVMLVATRTIVKEGVNHPELMSPESYKKMLETAKHHLQAYKLAIK